MLRLAIHKIIKDYVDYYTIRSTANYIMECMLKNYVYLSLIAVQDLEHTSRAKPTGVI